MEHDGVVRFLGLLDAHAREELHRRSRPLRRPAGTVLFAEGEPAHDVIVIRAGHVKVCVTAASGREVVLDVLEAGDVVGELSAIDGGARSATAVSLDATQLFVVPVEEFHDLLETCPGAAAAMLHLLAARVRGAARRQLEFGATDALGRVCLRLTEMAARYGTELGDGTIRIDAPFAQHEVAAWAGLSREAVVKALRNLRALRWVETRGRTITLLDRTAVQDRATA